MLPGRDPVFRAIAVASAIGEVGSFAISSSITETGCMISKPDARDLLADEAEPDDHESQRRRGAQRLFASRGGGTWASGMISAERMASV